MKTLLILITTITFSTLCYSQDGESFFKKGELKFNAGKYKEAIADYNDAIKADPKVVNYYLRRAFCYGMEQKYELSIADYRKVIELKPEHVWAYINCGSANNKLKRYNDALADFNKALEIEPKNDDAMAEAYNNRGWAKDGLGDAKGACDDWKKSKKLGNDEARKVIMKNTHCK